MLRSVGTSASLVAATECGVPPRLNATQKTSCRSEVPAGKRSDPKSWSAFTFTATTAERKSEEEEEREKDPEECWQQDEGGGYLEFEHRLVETMGSFNVEISGPRTEHS